jgi:hypothetical protein
MDRLCGPNGADYTRQHLSIPPSSRLYWVSIPLYNAHNLLRIQTALLKHLHNILLDCDFPSTVFYLFAILGGKYSQSLRTPRSKRYFLPLGGWVIRKAKAGQSLYSKPEYEGIAKTVIRMPAMWDVVFIMEMSTVEF